MHRLRHTYWGRQWGDGRYRDRQLLSVEQLKWWRRRESNPRPKALPRRTLHAYPLPMSHGRREEAAQNRRPPDPVKSRGWTPSHHPTASLLDDIWPLTTRRGQGRRSQLIKLRERTNYPQLTDVPSDLRVNGARHASYESSPPSKPCRPHMAAARTTETAGTELSLYGLDQVASNTSASWGCSAFAA
jgi:hypothetical protein